MHAVSICLFLIEKHLPCLQTFSSDASQPSLFWSTALEASYGRMVHYFGHVIGNFYLDDLVADF